MQLTEPSLRIIISLYTALWDQLCFPHITEVRRLTHETLVTLEGILNILLPALHKAKFRYPISTTIPLIKDQIIHQPVAILDPYILALCRNFYYPIAPEDVTITDETPMDTSHIEVSSPMLSQKKEASPTRANITVESSLVSFILYPQVAIL